MPTLTELKKLATKHKIKGRSKMNKAELETALNIKHKSRKAKVKKSRKAKVKKSRKAKVKKSRKAKVKKSRKAKVKKSRKAKVKKSRKAKVKKSRKAKVKKSRKAKVKKSRKAKLRKSVIKSKSRKSVIKSRSRKRMTRNEYNVLPELKRKIDILNGTISTQEGELAMTKMKLANETNKYSSSIFKNLPVFSQIRTRQDIEYLTGLEMDKTGKINRIRQDLYVLRNRYDRIKEIESLLGRRLTVREIHRLRHLISQLEPKYQKEYKDRMQSSLRKFRMGDKKVCPICLEHITENEIASGDVIGCTFSNANKEELTRYLIEKKGIKDLSVRSAIIKFFGNCCSKAKKVPTTCGAHYHINCISGWKKDTCPTCRRPVSAATKKIINPVADARNTRTYRTLEDENERVRREASTRTLGPTLNNLLKAGFITLATAAGVKTAPYTVNMLKNMRLEHQLGGYHSMNYYYPGSAFMCNPSAEHIKAATGTHVDDKNIYKPLYNELPFCPSGVDLGKFPLTHSYEPHVGSDDVVYYAIVKDAYPKALSENPTAPSAPDVCFDGDCHSVESQIVSDKYCDGSCATRGEIYKKHLKEANK